jgi:IS605 OrfB family transposase
LYNLCALSDGKIISSKKTVAVKRKYQYNRKKLQQKGTRSAKRKLKKLSGREMRFMRDFNHVVTKQLSSHDVSTYVLENLKGLRNQRKDHKLNSWLSNWSYFQFQSFLEYKCEFNGIEVVYVDPGYTSQKCNVCGVTEKNSRKKSNYICSSCGHIDHIDLNAAKNIRYNYVLSKRNRLFQEANSSEKFSATIPIHKGGVGILKHRVEVRVIFCIGCVR